MNATPTPPQLRFWPWFGLALAIRVAVVLVGLAMVPPGMDLKTDNPTPHRLQAHILETSARPIEPWFRFDSGWYQNIAENGYAGAADEGGRHGPEFLGPAFLPALPLCLAAAAAIGLNPYWTAMLLVNVAAAAGTTLLGRLAVRLTGDRNTGIRSFVLLSAYPASFFLSAPYNEAFGLLFNALALTAWLNRQAVRAGFFGALYSLARLTGISLGVAALGAWLCEDRSRSGFKRAAILAFGSFLGLALFCGYLHRTVGDAFAGVKLQEKWGRKNPALENLWLSVQSIYDPKLPHWGEGAVVLLFIVLGIRSWRKRGAFWGLVTLVPIGQMMISGTMLSAHRLILAALPGFIEMADLLRHPRAFRLVVALCLGLQLILLYRYMNWLFVG